MVDNSIIVIGGGVIGVSTFYELARRGLKPVLLEAAPDLATGTSFANGGMLTPSMPEPWNGPGVGGHLAASLFDPGSPMKIRLKALPFMVPWGLRFLWHSTAKSHQQATINNFKLAKRSVLATKDVVKKFGIRCDFSPSGAMKIFSSAAAMSAAAATAEMLTPLGLEYEALSAAEAIAVEPELASIKDRIGGAIFYREDAVGDAHSFTQALSKIAEDYGGSVKTDVRVRGIASKKGAVTGVATDSGFMAATDVIVAAGNASPSLVRRHGVLLPIKPAKGYSVTLDAKNWSTRPKVPIIDDSMHAAVAPIGDRIRIAGTAEFAGHNLALDDRRVENLHDIFSSIYPGLAPLVDRTHSFAWTGLRPMTADGLPIIGPAGPRGLWINSGQGHLGWTMAMGSAELIATLVMADEPALDPAPFRVGR